MLKKDELADPNSCLNRARDDEMIFVLLARDISAPGTVLDWIRRRIADGKNKPNDDQLADAERCAFAMCAQTGRLLSTYRVEPVENVVAFTAILDLGRKLLGACESFIQAAKDAEEHWQHGRDAKVGKLLHAMAGYMKNYRDTLTEAHVVINEARKAFPTGTPLIDEAKAVLHG